MTQAQFDRVARYSRLVRWMKVLLPLGAVALIVAMFLIPRESSQQFLTADEMARLGAGLVLDNPRFSGATDSGEPFEVVAKSALPDGPMPDLIELDSPVGRIVTGDHGLVTASAESGIFSRAAETLELIGGVTIVTEDGYEFRTETAFFEIGARALSTPGEIRASGPMGSIEAGKMRAVQSDGEEGLARIWFENRVHMVIIPGKTN